MPESEAEREFAKFCTATLGVVNSDVDGDRELFCNALAAAERRGMERAAKISEDLGWHHAVEAIRAAASASG